MKLIVDRFEEDYAVCEMEDKSFINIKRSDLPLDIKENDILEYDEKNKKIEKIDMNEEEKNKIEEVITNLWK